MNRRSAPGCRGLLGVAPLTALSLLLLLSFAAPAVAPGALAAATPRLSGLPQAEAAPALIATLQRPDATLEEKARACQFLAVVGTPDAAQALAPLLDHPQLSFYARTALEALANPAADNVLRAALARLSGGPLAGVVQSLGVRADAGSVAVLIPLVRDPARGVQAEALLALARITTPEAVEVVQAGLKAESADLRGAAAEACLVAAERELRRGRAAGAVALYDAVAATEGPAPLRLAAGRGAILARGEAGLPRLKTALAADDPDTRQMAVAAARAIPGPAATAVLVDALAQASPATQVLLVRALADRGDASVRGRLEAMAKADSPELRTASLEALGTLGAAASAPVLVESILQPRAAQDADTAAESLFRLSGADADAAILAGLRGAPAAARVRLIAVLGFRQAKGATAELLRQAGDPDLAVSKAAFEALAAVAVPGEIPRVIQAALACRDPGLRETAGRTLYNLALKTPDTARQADPLVEAFRTAKDPGAKTLLMEVMAMVANAPSYELIAGASTADPSAEVREAAFRLLLHWPDATPARLLLGVVQKTTNEVHRTLALRAVVTMTTLWTDPANAPRGATTTGQAALRPPREAVSCLAAAQTLVRDDPEEKRILLAGLGDLNCAEGLRLIAPYLDDPKVRTEAGQALVRSANRLDLAEEKRLAVPLLEKVVAGATDPELRQRATAALKKIGEPAAGR